MRLCILSMIAIVGALAQESTLATVASGVPLRVSLDTRVAIKRVGQPVEGRLTDPVYVFDKLVLPAGTRMEGHVAEIGGVPARRRVNAILSGNLTSARAVRAQFNTLVQGDGVRLPLRITPARGTAHMMRIGKQRKTGAPSQLVQLKSTLFGMLRYHRQSWAAGTVFNSTLIEPPLAPAQGPGEATAELCEAAGLDALEVSARLLAPGSLAFALGQNLAQNGDEILWPLAAQWAGRQCPSSIPKASPCRLRSRSSHRRG